MSDIPSSDAKKPMKQPDDVITEAMGNITVTAGDSDKTSPPKNLSDMPVDVVGMVIEKSEYKEQLILRKTSKSLRSLVDEQRPACTSIGVYRFEEDITIVFNQDNHVVYKAGEYELENQKRVDSIVMRDDFEKAAFEDLAAALKNPKLQLEQFVVGHNDFNDEEKIERFFKTIQRVLESTNHQLLVEMCMVQAFHPSQLLSIFPYLKPGKLEQISLMPQENEFDWSSDSAEMNQVASLDQWKQAEKLELWDSFDAFPMKYATHFKRFKIQEVSFDDDKFVSILDYLAKLENFEHCELSSEFFFSFDDTDHMGTLVSSSDFEEIYHYPTADSDYYLEFKTSVFSNRVDIDKKKKTLNN